jgi:hypothetical protein
LGESSSVPRTKALRDWNRSGYQVVRNASMRFETRALCSTSFSHCSPARPSLWVGQSDAQRNEFLLAAFRLSVSSVTLSVPARSFVSLQPSTYLDIPICKSFSTGYQGRAIVGKGGIRTIHCIPYQIILGSPM